MDFINRVIAVFGEWRKGSVFNVLITLTNWFNGAPKASLVGLTEKGPEYF